MDATRFDGISRLLAERRISRRQAVRQGATGLAAAGLAVAGLKAAGLGSAGLGPAAAAAQAATPSPTTGAKEFLFVQSFESGKLAPKAGAAGTYTATLQHGLGQTLYFSDRPQRIVGAAPTAKFLKGLGFNKDNPPNAALVVDDGDGGVNIAVVELADPKYEDSSHTATYDLKVLQDYEKSVDMKFQEAPANLAALGTTLGAAHLFIDDCPDAYVNCIAGNTDVGLAYGGAQVGTCWDWSTFQCRYCNQAAVDAQCNADFPACHNSCTGAINAL
jgi:hypothetical protein